MHIDKDDNIYVTVMFGACRLQVQPAGRALLTLGEWDAPSNPAYVIDLAAEGAVADPTWLGCLQSPTSLKAGRSGCLGPFTIPTDVAAGPTGDIYCSDGYGNARVQRFAPRRTPAIAGNARVGPGQFRLQHGIWVGRDSRVFIADRENCRLQVFDAEVNFLDQWTGFSHPCDFFVNDDGVMIVAEGI